MDGRAISCIGAALSRRSSAQSSHNVRSGTRHPSLIHYLASLRPRGSRPSVRTSLLKLTSAPVRFWAGIFHWDCNCQSESLREEWGPPQRGLCDNLIISQHYRGLFKPSVPLHPAVSDHVIKGWSQIRPCPHGRRNGNNRPTDMIGCTGEETSDGPALGLGRRMMTWSRPQTALRVPLWPMPKQERLRSVRPARIDLFRHPGMTSPEFCQCTILESLESYGRTVVSSDAKLKLTPDINCSGTCCEDSDCSLFQKGADKTAFALHLAVNLAHPREGNATCPVQA